MLAISEPGSHLAAGWSVALRFPDHLQGELSTNDTAFRTCDPRFRKRRPWRPVLTEPSGISLVLHGFGLGAGPGLASCNRGNSEDALALPPALALLSAGDVQAGHRRDSDNRAELVQCEDVNTSTGCR